MLLVFVWQATAVAAPLVTAHPGLPIRAIAVTEDGTAAITSDDRGVRFWPSLDGTREPVVVAMTPPVALAIQRSGDELVVGGIDTAGALEVARLTNAGELLSHRQIEAHCRAVYATPSGLLVRRDDQTIELLGHGTIAPDPGEQIDNVLVRNGAALALVRSDGKVRGRWIELGTKLAWGATTAELDIDPRRAALSPDHGRVVAATRRKLGVIELATGTVKMLEPIADDNVNTPVGFIDDETYAFDRGLGDRESVRYFVRGGKLIPAMGGMPVATADHRLVAGFGIDVEVQTPKGTQYLGYRIAHPRHVLATGGAIVVAGANEVAFADDELRTRKPHVFASPVRDVVPLDAAHVVTLGSGTAELVDLQKLSDPPQDLDTHVQWARYEPATRLLAVRHDQIVGLRRYDPKHGTLGPTATLPVPYDADFALLDPAWAHGMVAVVVHRGAGVALTWIRDVHDDDVVPGKTTTQNVPDFWEGDLAALGLDVHIVRKHGTLRAELRAQRLSLFDGKTLRWVIAARGIDDIAWRGDQLLALGGGLATVDLAAGRLDHMQCGWDFGLWNAPTQAEGGPVMCED